MNSAIIQLLVLAGIAIFLILRLRNVLGTREGFEKPREQIASQRSRRGDFEVIEGGIDRDIADHVPEKSELAERLARMKHIEPDFGVGEFLGGARGAYELRRVVELQASLGELPRQYRAEGPPGHGASTPAYWMPVSWAMSAFQVVRSLGVKSRRCECPHARASTFMSSTVAAK